MTIKDKNLSFQASTLLHRLLEEDLSCFNLAKANELLPGSNTVAVKKLVSDMTKRGLFMRVRENLYHIIPFDQDPEIYMPDWHLLAACLVEGANYYIGYYSALQIHHLITQPSLKEQIVVNQQQKPTTQFIRKVPFQYIYHNDSHFFGFSKVWIDSYHKVYCSDPEKTIIDCLFKPEYAGGIVEAAKAIYILRDKLNFSRLDEYLVRFSSQAVLKRLGFLLELLNIETPYIMEWQKRKSQSYVVLDTMLPKKGKHNSRWSVLQNLDSNTIITAAFT